jgi:hypothetical protein
LDNSIIVWAPRIPHFKGLGMRNLQYEVRICQKSHDKVTKTVFVDQTLFGKNQFEADQPGEK